MVRATRLDARADGEFGHACRRVTRVSARMRCGDEKIPPAPSQRNAPRSSHSSNTLWSGALLPHMRLSHGHSVCMAMKSGLSCRVLQALWPGPL